MKTNELKDGMVGVFKGGYYDIYCGIYIGNTFITPYSGIKMRDNTDLKRTDVVKVIEPTHHRTIPSNGYHAGFDFWCKHAEFLNYPHKVLWERRDILSFKQFLEDSGIDWKTFIKNCRVENQRWSCTSMYYDSIDDLKCGSESDWVINVFNWDKALQHPKETSWIDLSTNWSEKVETAIEKGIDIVWE